MPYALDHRLSFGKFRGRSIKELIVPDCSTVDFLISKYLEELCDTYLKCEVNHKIPTPMRIRASSHYSWFKTLGKKKNTLVEANLEVFVTDRYLINKKISLRSEFSDFIHYFLNFDFSKYGLDRKSMSFNGGVSSEFSENSKKLDACFSAISYLKWLVDTVGNFKLSDSAIEQLYEVKLLAVQPDHICFRSINHDVVEYSTALAPVKDLDRAIDEIVRLNSAKVVSRYIPDEYLDESRPVDPWVDAFGDLADDAYWNTN